MSQAPAGVDGPAARPAPLRVAVTLEQCWHRVPGGTAVAALRSVEAVRDLGWVSQVGVAARHRAAPGPPWTPAIPVRFLPLPRAALYETWHRLRWPSVESATGPVTVIHATGLAIPPRTVPLVVTQHDLAWRRHPEHFTSRGVRFFERSLELTVRDADVVVCPSRATATDLVGAGVPADRVRVVPWGVDPRVATRPEVARVRRAWGLDRPYVLWTGTIEPRKNLPTLLEAFHRLALADTDLVLVGPQGWHDALPPFPPTRGRVHRLGLVPATDLPALYAGADAFCYPSLMEGFGLPVLEAMAQGTPVVTSAGTATEELVGSGGMAVDPTSVVAVTEAMAWVLEHRDELEAPARAQASKYSWETTARRLGEIYGQLAR